MTSSATVIYRPWLLIICGFFIGVTFVFIT